MTEARRERSSDGIAGDSGRHARGSGARVGPRRFGLGLRQRRLRQNACAGAALAAAIVKAGAEAPDAARLNFARRLFARTIETPGGLKIQTIHAFCERLLHLFPFEANVA